MTKIKKKLKNNIVTFPKKVNEGEANSFIFCYNSSDLDQSGKAP